MGIQIQNNRFLFTGRRSSYAFAVTKKSEHCEAGFLRHLHWGGIISMDDLPNAETLFRSQIGVNGPRRVEVQAQEYPAWGGQLRNEPALKISYEDGVRSAVLKYASHEVQENHLTVILCDDRIPELTVELHYRFYPQFDLIDRWSVLRNNTTQKIRIESILSAAWQFPVGRIRRLTHLAGRWGKEHSLNRTILSQSKIVLENTNGLSGPFNEPFFCLDDGSAGEEYGNVYCGALHWSGNWKIAIEKNSYDMCSATGGIHDFDFSCALAPGESFETPVFSGLFSPNGFGGASRALHDYQREILMPQTIMQREMPLVFNSWRSLHNTVSEERVLQLAEKAESIGIELFVIDDGWQKALGDWTPDPVKFPNGLKKISQQMRKSGMTLGLWAEIESFEVKSDLYQRHPEWALRYQAADPVYVHRKDMGRSSLILNLAIPEVAEYLYDSLDRLIGENDIGYFKIDMNTYISTPGWDAVPKDRQQSVWVDYVRNLYLIFARLQRKYPDVIFENCAAGSARSDLGMMHFFTRINRSDNQDTLDILSMHEGFTYLHPARSAGGACHISDESGAVNGRSLPLQYQAVAGMTGSLSIACNLCKASGEKLQLLKEYGDLYKKIRHIPQFGDLYRICSVSTSKAAVFEFVSKDQKEVCVVVLGHSTQFADCGFHFQLKGLNRNYIYRLTAYGDNYNSEIMSPLPETASGAGLMEYGVDVPLKGDFDSRLLLYRNV